MVSLHQIPVPQGAEALATALKDADSSLQVLHLEDNLFGPEGSRALAAGLWHCHSLQELHLGNTGIGDEGLAPLPALHVGGAESVSRHQSLCVPAAVTAA